MVDVSYYTMSLQKIQNNYNCLNNFPNSSWNTCFSVWILVLKPLTFYAVRYDCNSITLTSLVVYCLETILVDTIAFDNVAYV